MSQGAILKTFITYDLLVDNVILGNILYLVYIFFGYSESSFGEFTSGLLLGLSVGISLIGIIMLIIYVSKEK